MTQPKIEMYVKSNEVFDFLEQYHGHAEVHPDYVSSNGVWGKDYTGEVHGNCILLLVDQSTHDTIQEKWRAQFETI